MCETHHTRCLHTEPKLAGFVTQHSCPALLSKLHDSIPPQLQKQNKTKENKNHTQSKQQTLVRYVEVKGIKQRVQDRWLMHVCSIYMQRHVPLVLFPFPYCRCRSMYHKGKSWCMASLPRGSGWPPDPSSDLFLLRTAARSSSRAQPLLRSGEGRRVSQIPKLPMARYYCQLTCACPCPSLGPGTPFQRVGPGWPCACPSSPQHHCTVF